jgi:hypothetical protein
MLILPEKKLPKTPPRFVITNRRENRWTLSSFEVFSARNGLIDMRSTSPMIPYKREKIARTFELSVIAWIRMIKGIKTEEITRNFFRPILSPRMPDGKANMLAPMPDIKRIPPIDALFKPPAERYKLKTVI